MVDVPCNGCTACCRMDGPRVVSAKLGDNVLSYKTRVAADRSKKSKVVIALAVKPNGDCIYLRPGGCDVWHRRPNVCQMFDCRILYQALRPEERERIAALSDGFKDILNAAEERTNGDQA